MYIYVGLILMVLNLSNSLTLPKIFMDEMVLQGAPEIASIWGFLDEDSTNLVELFVDCTELQETHTFTPKEVILEESFMNFFY